MSENNKETAKENLVEEISRLLTKREELLSKVNDLLRYIEYDQLGFMLPNDDEKTDTEKPTGFWPLAMDRMAMQNRRMSNICHRLQEVAQELGYSDLEKKSSDVK